MDGDKINKSESESFSEFSKEDYTPPSPPKAKPQKKSSRQEMPRKISDEMDKKKNYGQMRKLT